MNKPNKQTAPTIVTVADAERAIANLEAKRDALVQRGGELANVRASVAYKALTDGDETARATLDKINRQTVEHSSELQIVRDLKELADKVDVLVVPKFVSP
jgi:hypothetical protein